MLRIELDVSCISQSLRFFRWFIFKETSKFKGVIVVVVVNVVEEGMSKEHNTFSWLNARIRMPKKLENMV